MTAPPSVPSDPSEHPDEIAEQHLLRDLVECQRNLLIARDQIYGVLVEDRAPLRWHAVLKAIDAALTALHPPLRMPDETPTQARRRRDCICLMLDVAANQLAYPYETGSDERAVALLTTACRLLGYPTNRYEDGVGPSAEGI